MPGGWEVPEILRDDPRESQRFSEMTGGMHPRDSQRVSEILRESQRFSEIPRDYQIRFVFATPIPIGKPLGLPLLNRRAVRARRSVGRGSAASPSDNRWACEAARGFVCPDGTRLRRDSPPKGSSDYTYYSYYCLLHALQLPALQLRRQVLLQVTLRLSSYPKNMI